jgi:hypothetical protein
MSKIWFIAHRIEHNGDVSPENYNPTESLLDFLIPSFTSSQYFVPPTQLHNNENTIVYKYMTWFLHVSAYNGILLGGRNHRKA